MNILFVVRVKKRNEPDPGYASRRLRDQAGEITDWLPDGTWPGNAIIDNPEFRIIRVTGAAMTEALATALCSGDVLRPEDAGKGFLPRRRVWQIRFQDLPAAALNALRTKVPYAQRGTIYDASYTVSQVNSIRRLKAQEPRTAEGLPADDGEALDDL